MSQTQLKVFTCLHCINLTPLEELILTLIKGELLDAYQENESLKMQNCTSDIEVREPFPNIDLAKPKSEAISPSVCQFTITNTFESVTDVVKKLQPFITNEIKADWDGKTRVATITVTRSVPQIKNFNHEKSLR